MENPWLDDAQMRVWRQWLRVGTELPAAMNRQLQRDSGMSIQDFEILVRLSESDTGRLRIGALADEAGWERSRLSHHLRRMEGRGLILREGCREDGRGTFVCLTPMGRTALKNAAPGHAGLVRRAVFEHLSPAELDALGTATTRILEKLAVEG